MSKNKVWFSHGEEIYEVKKGGFLKKGGFAWTGKTKIWNWDNCTVGLAKPTSDRTLIIVRSVANKNSKFMGDRPVKVSFMLGFEIKRIVSGPGFEKPDKGIGTLKKGVWNGSKGRYVIRLRGSPAGDGFDWSDDYWIWVYDDDLSGMKNIDALHRQIEDNLSSKITSDNIFRVGDASANEEIVPVIYQPAVDSLKNFIREINCKRQQKNGVEEVEVTLIFENERLQKSDDFDKTYKFARKDLLFGREKDIERFKIILKDGKPDHLLFPGIYSKEVENGVCRERDILFDSTHGDTTKNPDNTPKRPIEYFFADVNHPVVFVNTSNHAMAGDDANHRLWKWEYIPWEEDGAAVYHGNISLEDVEARFPEPPLLGIPKWIFDRVNRLRQKNRASCDSEL